MATEANVAAMGKAEKERYQACVEVSDRCVKLLRKTRLQVRAVVEVFHCKSPKHMITEVVSSTKRSRDFGVDLTNTPD